MKTVGQVIKDLRTNKKLSLSKIERDTKIKKEFIRAIEDENWEMLPEFPVVLGFVRNIAIYLGANPNSTVALLRRDYPPKILSVNPKPDVVNRFVWSPKITFIVGAVLVIIVFLSYLGFQYYQFIGKPKLSINLPIENQLVEEDFVEVAGKTNADATIKINNQPVIVDADGNFNIKLALSEDTREIVIIAQSRSGKQTVSSRKIKREEN